MEMTPIEELAANLRLHDDERLYHEADVLMFKAAEALESQALRIKLLESQNLANFTVSQGIIRDLTAERDEYREKYEDTYYALDDAARENTILGAQLAESKVKAGDGSNE